MKKLPALLLLSTALSLSACAGQIGQQWMDRDKTFAIFDQPTVKGVNETQETMAKEAVVAGDFARAAQFYQQLVDAGKGSPEQVLRYKLGLAESVRRMGRVENALIMYNELHDQNPENVDIMEGRALSLMATGKTSDAGRAFSEVIEKDPKRWRSLNALGILFVTKSMVPEAIAYYTEALSQSPDNAAVLNNVGLSYATDKKFPRAIDALKQASRVSKNAGQRKQIDLNLAMVYGVSGDLETSREIAAKYLEGPALDNNLGLYAHLAKDDALAKSYLNMALTQSPTYYERAWDNLDMVSDGGRSDSSNASPAMVKKRAAKLPAIEKLDVKPASDTPVEAAPKAKSKRGSKAKAVEKKSEAKVEEKPEVTVEPAIEVKPETKAEEKSDKPAEKSVDTKTDAKAEPVMDVKPPMTAADKAKEILNSTPETDKPAGLIVTPSE